MKTPPQLEKVFEGLIGAPTIIETKMNLLPELFPILNSLRLNFRQMPMFNMASTFLNRQALTQLVDLDAVHKIYIDWPVRLPEIPYGFTDLNFLQHPGAFGFGILQQSLPGNIGDTSEWITTVESGQFIGVDQAHADGITGAGVNVAVVDSDASARAANQRQLFGKSVERYQVRAPAQTDSCGHGGHVAATINGNLYQVLPNVQVRGVAPGAHLLLVKCLLTPLGSGSTSDCIEGLNIAFNHGTDVVNLSLGSSSSDPSADAFVQAINKLPDGKIVCAASGNDGKTTIGTPAIAKNALAIGALNSRTNTTASFSNTGSQLAFTMPGVNIFSGLTRDTLCDIEGKGPPGFAMLSGTSMATPHATGMVALAIELMRKYGFQPTTQTFRDIGQRYGIGPQGPLTYQMVKQYVQDNLT